MPRRSHEKAIRSRRRRALLALSLVSLSPGQVEAEPAAKPNILVIWGDDIGGFNINAYNQGVMGYRTPNIDRIGKEGAMFTDWYGQQSCTAGRAAFITGQSPIRTGLTKVGLPGAPEGMKKEDPTIATLLKPLGYVTGQFGKNHLGDRDEMMPTANGFHEFFGNLYHLNAEEEPENADYPKDPEFKKKFGPRGVIHSWAMPDGPEDRGHRPVDEEAHGNGRRGDHEAALNFIDKAHKDGKPFFVWWNSTRMHIFTHLKPESEGKTGLGIYADGMVEHDGMVGQLLDKLKELGIEDNTIVMYSTDNGAETFTWPDGGTTMFRGEKNTNWEGGYRVPAFIKWPGTIKPGTIINDIGAHEDMLPTLSQQLVIPTSWTSCSKARPSATGPTKFTWTATTSRLRLRARANGRARNSSTGQMTATWRRCATTIGRSLSSSRRRRACASGRSRSMCCARRS